MPIWLIRTRDDNGKDEKIKVRANDAGEAIRVAEVDINHVLVVKTGWGTWGDTRDGTAKWETKNKALLQIAMLTASIYLVALSIDGIDALLGNPGLVPIIVVYAIAMGLVVAGSVFYRERRTKVEEQRADVHEVLKRNEITVHRWHTPLVRWSLLLMGIGVCVTTAVNLQEDAFTDSFMALGPLSLLWFAVYDPTDFA